MAFYSSLITHHSFMTEKAKVKRRVVIARAVLLVEIERRCADPDCNAKARIGLTKEEARAYTGFKCERCEQWNDDALAERDIPDWWEELFVIRRQGMKETETFE